MLDRYRPMLPSASTEPFHRPGWIFEEKIDGWRVLAYMKGAEVELVNREGRSCTQAFPEIATALRALPAISAVLDGELARFDERLVSRFDFLPRHQTGTVATPPLYAAFDLLELDGVSLLDDPLKTRRQTLERLLERTAPLLFPVRRLGADGLAAFAEAERRGWEGVVAKDPQSPYRPGERTDAWIKTEVRHVDRVLVGAVVLAGEQEGAIQVGVPDAGSLRYAGTVRCGLDGDKGRELLAAALHVTRRDSPFRDEQSGDVVYVHPVLEVEVQHSGWVGGQLRDPVYRRLAGRLERAPLVRLRPRTGPR